MPIEQKIQHTLNKYSDLILECVRSRDGGGSDSPSDVYRMGTAVLVQNILIKLFCHYL